MRLLADLVYLLAGLLYLPVAIYNAVVLGKNRGGWGQRFGAVPRFDPGRKRIWIHAVSLGEMNATTTLAAALRERLPDVELVFSSTTDTGFARGVALYGPDRVFRFPLDFSFVISRALRRIQPSLIVLMELEVWPNLVRMASSRAIPIAIANGRLTQRSAGRLRQLGPFCRAMFGPFAWVGVQDEDIFYGFRELGVRTERIEITGSLKWDTASVVDHVPGADALAKACGLDTPQPVWVCGSTGPREEEIILDAYKLLMEKFEVRSSQFEGEGTEARRHEGSKTLEEGQDGDRTLRTSDFELRTSAVELRTSERSLQDVPRLVIVPRKPERFDEVASLIEGRGYRCIRRTVSPDGTERFPLTSGDVVLGDTMGELRKFYSLCSVAFVGRSLVPMGGSDTMEVAALGKPMIVGPFNENFREPFGVFNELGVLKIVDSAATLAAAVEAWLRDPLNADLMGDRARKAVLSGQGATKTTVDALVGLLQET